MKSATNTLDNILGRLKTLLPLLREQYQVKTLEIFGSYVRGEARSDSDLHILVTFGETPSMFQFVALENFLSDQLGIKVDLVMKDSLKPGLAPFILEEARAV